MKKVEHRHNTDGSNLLNFEGHPYTVMWTDGDRVGTLLFARDKQILGNVHSASGPITPAIAQEAIIAADTQMKVSECMRLRREGTFVPWCIKI